MKNKLSRMLTAGVAAAALVALAGCSGGGGAPSEGGGEEAQPVQENVTVQLSWVPTVEYAGEFFAIEDGYFEEGGIENVELLPGPVSTESIVLGGQAQIGVTTPVALAPAVLEEQAPLKIIGAVYQKNPSVMLSLPEAGIKEPKDLVGKRIGVQPGNTEVVIDSFLRANDIDPSEVTKVPITYDPMELVNGDIDAMGGYITNEVLVLEAAGHELNKISYEDYGLPYVVKTYIATDDYIAQNRATLKAYLTAVIKGWQDSLADVDESVRLSVEVFGKDIGNNPDMERTVAEVQNSELIVSDNTQANGLLTMSDEMVQDTLDSLKLIGYDVTADQIFDLSLVDEIYEENPELIK